MADPVLRVPAHRPAPSPMADEVRRGLLAPCPSLPSKYFYDDRGSALFEAITELPEYYQTRTEVALLDTVAGDVVQRVRPLELVELGSGAGRKIARLLDAMTAGGGARRLLLFDINAALVQASAERLARRFPAATVRGVTGDFSGPLSALGPGGRRLVVLFGGTIGNLFPREVPPFLERLARQLEPGDAFLVGVDQVKDPARLEAAYNDAAGITAAFNRNILSHVNTALGGDFDPRQWDHVAFYDRHEQWIEMRLRATADCRVRIAGAGVDRAFRRGDEIRTEVSCKYTERSFARLLPGTGLALERWYQDPERLFALALLRRERAILRPV